ncbi:glucosaminidase domain-containing protein [Aedoeadaptatus coxii]|uniref:glycoside hydrolase family 73 protein n=1 Tax=Aedoeadaptatus coxii TaxID=755172 RepID=UPI002AD55339|nr:glucosaminidase domain-containing protein [Peptoniphilus coxii]
MSRKRNKKAPSKRQGCLILLALFVVIIFWTLRPRYNPDPELIHSREEFFETYGPLAQEVGKRYHLIPSVILAQAAVESNFGESQLSKEYHNYFGIKGRGKGSVMLSTTEFFGESEERVRDGFRTYDSPRESFYDYGKLIAKAPRYEKVREATTREAYAQALHPAGYSTNPRYGEILLNTIAQYNLARFDD